MSEMKKWFNDMDKTFVEILKTAKKRATSKKLRAEINTKLKEIAARRQSEAK